MFASIMRGTIFSLEKTADMWSFCILEEVIK